jgi:hypothetical protein
VTSVPPLGALSTRPDPVAGCHKKLRITRRVNADGPGGAERAVPGGGGGGAGGGGGGRGPGVVMREISEVIEAGLPTSSTTQRWEFGAFVVVHAEAQAFTSI